MSIVNTYRNSNVSPTYLEEYREKYIPLTYLSPRIYSNASRYTNLRRLQDTETGNIYHENWVQKQVDLSNQDQFFTVTQLEEGRLDIISNKFYDTPRYWWVIAISNSILDAFDVPIGTTLRIPPIISLYNQGGILSDN